MKYPLDATRETYAKLTLMGKPVLFTCSRVNRKTVPEGMYMYEIRYSDEGAEPCQIGKWIMVNYYGTILSKEPFNLIPSKTTTNSYCDFDYDTDWQFEDWGWTMDTYLQDEYMEAV